MAIANPGWKAAYIGQTYDYVREEIAPRFDAVFREMDRRGFPLRRHWLPSFMRYDLVGGGALYLRSFDKYERLKGWDLATVALDEVEQHSAPRVMWTDLAACLRSVYVPWPQVHGTTTPKGMRGIVEMFAEARSTDRRAKFWTCRAPSTVNPHLDPEQLANWRATMSKRQYAQEVMCEILLPPSVIFCEFDRGRHLVPHSYDPSMPYDIACDWGYNHPCVLFIQRQAGDVGIIFDEIINDEVPETMLRRMIVEKCKRLGAEPQNAVGDRADKRAMSWLKTVFPGAKIKRMDSKHEQQVTDGIERVRDLLDPVEGEPKIYVADRLAKAKEGRGVVRSLEHYRYRTTRDGAVLDVPHKDNVYDHACDCLRYWAVALHGTHSAPYSFTPPGGGYADPFARAARRRKRRPRFS